MKDGYIFFKTSVVCLFFLLSQSVGRTAAITFEGFSLLGSYRSDGLVDLSSIGTWNGQPISDSNKPSDYERQLATTVNLFAQSAQPNVLFLQITDVTTTHFGYAFGSAFNNVTDTGVRFSLPLVAGGILGLPTLSLDHANPGQARAYTPPDYSTEPISTTPGFGLSSGGLNQFLIQTVNGSDYGFINGYWGVYGGTANRILGGGVFQLTFDSGTDLLGAVDYNAAVIESQYGRGNQYITATLVPEPTMASLISGSLLLWLFLMKANSEGRHA